MSNPSISDIYDTPGRLALKRFLKKNSITYAEAAAYLNVSTSAVGNWCAGTRRPDKVSRSVLQHWAGIDAAYWLTDKESELCQEIIESLPSSTAKETQ